MAKNHIASCPPFNRRKRREYIRGEKSPHRIRVPSGKLSLMSNTTIVMKGPSDPSQGIVTIDTIPDIAIALSDTHDMSQYINDTGNIRTGTAVNGLASFATYSSVTELLTGASVGTETGLTLEVTF